MNLWNFKKEELIEPPRLIQYADSNHPFYKKGIKLVNAAYASKLGISYDSYWKEIRSEDTHGRCSGKFPKKCHHCQTIEAATKAVEEGPEWL